MPPSVISSPPLPPLRPDPDLFSTQFPPSNHSAEHQVQLHHPLVQASYLVANKTWLDLFPDSKPIFPSDYPPSSLIAGQLTMKIPSIMIEPNRNSYAAIGRFFGKRTTVEWLTLQANSSWNLSKPCLISLTNKGHFLFRFSSKADKDLAISRSPYSLQNRKLHLLP
ncbi:hypothetical protein MRB53_015614 [Persea americana]|uniref:Uncharacterized protein n=1 Tax=Persea americana TaxID=3435 RepID=A0ACC2LZV0_PERAE|nr:hypothetical protein MRB53_015614 [Persea americana]